MGKYIVMDVVFKASSLNYDQGSGNYQELKKITRWNGKQYTFVSRYALRYSLLETGKENGWIQIAKGENLQLHGQAENKVIQPSSELLLSGGLLKYPEFDMFGYLITSTKPQNFREAPVKISPAISMTPYNYDALFNANIGMANRMRKIKGDMSPNPFTSEEHETFYQYSIVIDVDSVRKLDLYLKKGEEVDFGEASEKWKLENAEPDKSDNTGKLKFTLKKNKKVKIIESDKEVKVEGNHENEGIYHIVYSISDREEKIKNLIKCIMNLHRSIKGRDEDLSPKLLVLGFYENKPYKTFKDRIELVDEISEESIDEITETTEGSKKIVKVVHKTIKQTRPKFRIGGLDKNNNLKDENDVVTKVEEFLKGKNKSGVYLYKIPEIEVEKKTQN